MTFELNQIFSDTYPPEAAQFCNANGYVIKELDKQDGKRRFQIQEIPVPTAAEQAAARRQEILSALSDIDAKKVRSASAIALAIARGETPDQTDVAVLTQYEEEATALREELQTLGEE